MLLAWFVVVVVNDAVIVGPTGVAVVASSRPSPTARTTKVKVFVPTAAAVGARVVRSATRAPT